MKLSTIPVMTTTWPFHSQHYTAYLEAPQTNQQTTLWLHFLYTLPQIFYILTLQLNTKELLNNTNWLLLKPEYGWQLLSPADTLLNRHLSSTAAASSTCNVLTKWLTHSLTNLTENNPSWEAAGFSADHKIPLDVHYHVNTSLPVSPLPEPKAMCDIS
jgi:hypothetical protein